MLIITQLIKFMKDQGDNRDYGSLLRAIRMHLDRFDPESKDMNVYKRMDHIAARYLGMISYCKLIHEEVSKLEK